MHLFTKNNEMMKQVDMWVQYIEFSIKYYIFHGKFVNSNYVEVYFYIKSMLTDIKSLVSLLMD